MRRHEDRYAVASSMPGRELSRGLESVRILGPHGIFAAMNELTPSTLIEIWTSTKAQKRMEDPDLARMQKFMVMHEDLHGLWDKLVEDPATSLMVEDENMMLHIAMDAATEGALEAGQPEGLRGLFQALTTAGFDPGQAFHVLQQAMTHEFLIAAEKGEELSLDMLLNRATDYTGQAMRQGAGESPDPSAQTPDEGK